MSSRRRATCGHRSTSRSRSVGGVDRADELVAIIGAEPWIVDVLRTARAERLPDWFVGAGAVRDLVWDLRYGRGFHAENIADIDLVYFDPTDLSKEREHEVEGRLGPRWDVTNQAAVHTWFNARFGGDPVDPLTSTADGIATWPETATCVGVRLEEDDTLTITAPLGLDDLLDGVWRSNPVRVTPDEAARRLAKKDPGKRWPGVRVV
jgi:uncharacterized protein